MRKNIFIPSLLIFCILMFPAILIYFNNVDERTSYDYFPSALKVGLWFILFYFISFFAFYFFLKRTGFTSSSVFLFCLVFLLLSPTIKSSTIIITDTDSWNSPVFEDRLAINPGTPYNKLSCFTISLLNLLTIKDIERFHNKTMYIDRYKTSFKRLEALNHSNSYQLHFFSILVNLLFFIFLFFVLKNGGIRIFPDRK